MASLAVRRDRRADGIQWKLHKPVFVWEFPWIQATGPERMVFAELVSRHIAFNFQELLTEAVPLVRGLPVLNQSPYRADFIIPSIKVVLDPWDDYHHALPDQAKNDAEKLAVYQALGFRTYHIWGSELERNGVSWWFAQIPGLDKAAEGTFKLFHTQDDSAGIRALNRSRTKPPNFTLRSRRSRGRRS